MSRPRHLYSSPDYPDRTSHVVSGTLLHADQLFCPQLYVSRVAARGCRNKDSDCRETYVQI